MFSDCFLSQKSGAVEHVFGPLFHCFSRSFANWVGNVLNSVLPPRTFLEMLSFPLNLGTLTPFLKLSTTSTLCPLSTGWHSRSYWGIWIKSVFLLLLQQSHFLYLGNISKVLQWKLATLKDMLSQRGKTIPRDSIYKKMCFYDPVIPLLGIYLKKPETLIQKNIRTPVFTAALGQDLEAAQMPFSRWVDKKVVVHLHNRILLGYKKRKKEGNLALCDSKDGPGEHYAKWNKPVGERQVPYDFTHTWNLMNK